MVNWDDLVKDAGDSAQSFEPLPKADYNFQVVDAETTMTKAGDKKMYKIKAKVLGGQHDGRLIWDQIVLPPDGGNALGYFFRKMAAMGLTTEYFRTQNPSDERICSDLKNRQFRAQVGHRVWQGENRHQIEKYYGPIQDSNAPQAMTGATPPPAAASAPPAAAPAAPPAAPPQAAPAPAAPPAEATPPAPPVQPEQPQAPVAPPAPPAPAEQPEVIQPQQPQQSGTPTPPPPPPAPF